MLSIVMLMVINLAQPADPPPVAEPPMPDFKTKVDYVQWYKDQIKFADADNAWQEYWKFMEEGRQPRMPDDVSNEYKNLPTHSPWQSSDYPKFAKWLEEVEPLLQAYTEGTKHKFFAQPLNDAKTLFDVRSVLAPNRELTRALVTKSWQADKKIDGDLFAKNMMYVIRHANHLGQGLKFIDQVTFFSLKKMAYGHIIGGIRADLFSEKELNDLQTELQKEDYQNLATHCGRLFMTELAGLYDLIQGCCTEKDQLKNQFSRTAITANKKQIVEAITDAQMEQMLKEEPSVLCRQAKDYWIDMAQQCTTDLPFNVDLLVKNSTYRPLIESSVFFRMQLAPPDSMFEGVFSTETQRRGTQLLLSLVIQKKKVGSWPTSLDTISPPLDKTIRTDPRSGKDFIYKVTGDQMTLYSVGKDGVDNGGKVLGDNYSDKDGEDLVIWPVK